MAGRACTHLHLALAAFTGTVGNGPGRCLGAGRASSQEQCGKRDGRHHFHGFSHIGSETPDAAGDTDDKP